MRERGEILRVLGEGRKEGGRILIKTESVYSALYISNIIQKRIGKKAQFLHTFLRSFSGLLCFKYQLSVFASYHF